MIDKAPLFLLVSLVLFGTQGCSTNGDSKNKAKKAAIDQSSIEESQPGGSYSDSCIKDSIEWQTPMLSADCKYSTTTPKSSGSSHSTLDYSKCKAGSTVSNFNGGLVCDYPAPPKGSYMEFCYQTSYVDGILKVYCPYRYGEKQFGPYRWAYFSLDYVKKCEPGSVVNYSTNGDLFCAEKKKPLTPTEFENMVRSQLWIENNRKKGFGEHKLEIINHTNLTLSITPQFKKALPDNGQVVADIPATEITLAPGKQTQYAYTVGVKPDFFSTPSLIYELQVTNVDYPDNTIAINLAIAPEVSISDFITISLAEQSEQEKKHNEITCQQVPVDYVDPKAYPILCHSRKLKGANIVRYVPLIINPVPPFENWQVQNFIDNGGLKSVYQQTGVLNHQNVPKKSILQCAKNGKCSPKHDEDIPDDPSVTPPAVFNPFYGLIPALIGSLIPSINVFPPNNDEPVDPEDPDQQTLTLYNIRRPDLMDPRTRVDTLQVVCFSDTDEACVGALEITGVELQRTDTNIMTTVGALIAPDNAQYYPNGKINKGQTLEVGDKREVAYQITPKSNMQYVEGHYQVTYQDTKGQKQSYESTKFGGIMD